MKKSGSWGFVVIVALFTGFLAGILAGRSIQADRVEISPLLQQAEATVSEKDASISAGSITQESPAQIGTVPVNMVNINTASLEELDKLPGIGPSIAQQIIDYRTEHGAFNNIYELINISGIGEKKLAAILDYITVEDKK